MMAFTLPAVLGYNPFSTRMEGLGWFSASDVIHSQSEHCCVIPARDGLMSSWHVAVSIHDTVGKN